MKYLVQSPAESEVGPSSSVHSVFEVMMVARMVVTLPEAMEGTLSKKDEFTTTCVRGYTKRSGSWDCRPTFSGFFRESIYKCVTDVFWCTDGHHGSRWLYIKEDEGLLNVFVSRAHVCRQLATQ